MTAHAGRTRRPVRRASLVAAALSTAAVLLQASPASSTVVVPDWPSTGYAPDGCASVAVAGSPPQFTYTDTSNPTVQSVDINGTDRLVTVPNRALPIAFRVRMTQTCSGIKGAAMVITGTSVSGLLDESLTFTSTDAWHPMLEDAGHAVPSTAGIFFVSAIETLRRYDTFVLSFPDYRLVSKTDSSGLVVATGPWALKPLYVLRGTRMTAGVTASAFLLYADNTAWKSDNGETIAVQTKVGKNRFKTVATLTTSSKGTVSYTFKPGATTLVRFVHSETHTGRFTASATSTVLKVTVA
jgi:hypothetical protein